jgi:DNA (cytosine-5)-methyltransferase 1
MNHLSLFSGIGGFDLASEWMGWNNIAHCEWNIFAQKVLKHYWPNAISYHDITKTDFTVHKGKIDIVTGGFPCQPYSQAGKRLGKEDERHLWPEMLRAIREIQPRFVVGENVSGLINWNGGMVFNEVQADLEAEGYSVTPFILPACAVNAPHRRDRVWFVAYCANTRFKSMQHGGKNGVYGFESTADTNCFNRRRGGQLLEQKRRQQTSISDESGIAPHTESGRQRGLRNESETTGTREGNQPPRSVCRVCDATNSSSIQLQGRKQHRSIGSSGEIKTEGGQFSGSICSKWQDFPTQSPVCDGNDGFSPRLDGITFLKWRNESIKAGGNAIVPQVAFQIFKSIGQFLITQDV